MLNHPASEHTEKSEKRTDQYLFFILEYGVYLYVFWLFFDKGESLRNIGLYSAFAVWLILVFFRKRVTFSLDVITLGFFIYLGSTVLSTIFSVDPIYSFTALKKDVLKAVITFFIISTCFTQRMLLRMSGVMCITGLILLSLGLFGFITGDTNIYTSKNIFLSADKNQYGFYIGLLFPFFIMAFAISSILRKKLLWGLASSWAVFGAVFSASRGAMGNVFTTILVFVFFLFKKKHLKILFAGSFILILLAIFTFKFWPEPLKFRLLSTPHHLSTFDDRTVNFWIPAMEAVKKRPILGWGYGKKLARDPRPFENSKTPDFTKKGQLHNSFITNLFHQGIVGLLSYLYMLLSTGFVLFRIAKEETDERKILALTLLSIIVGSFFVNSFLKTVAFRRVAPLLAMSAALYKNRK